MFKIPATDPGVVVLSTCVYHLLLIFYPSHFQREYGSDMAKVFRDSCLNAYRRSGLRAMPGLWALTGFDWFKSVIEEQLNRQTEMTQRKFIRLSGWGLVLAAVSLLLTFLSDTQIRAGLDSLLGAPTTASGDVLYEFLTTGAARMPFLFANILITWGLLGLGARYGEHVGKVAKMALGAGALGGVVSSLTLIIDYENGRPLMNFSMAVLFVGLLVFGLIALRKKPMPHGNALPALASFWFPFIVIGSNVYHQVTGHWLNVSFWPSFALFSIMSFFLGWLGIALQSDVPPEKAAAQTAPVI